MSVDTTNPGKGNPDDILRTAEERADKAASVRTAATTMARLAGESGNVWAGAAQVEFAMSAARASRELEVLASRWEAEAAALATYARAVQEIQDAQLPLRLRLEDAADERRYLAVLRADAEFDVAIALVPGGAPEAEQRHARLTEDIGEVDALLTRLQTEWDELVAQRAAADRACVDALSGAEVTGFSPALLAGTASAAALAGLSATDLLVLARTDPDALAALTQGDPAVAAAWWDAMAESDRQRLIDGLPTLIGSLGGVPAEVRVEANRIAAVDRVAWIDREMARIIDAGYGTTSTQPYADAAAAAEYLNRLRELRTERDYLQRAVDGDVQLYLYDHDKGQIIEMFGTPSTADVILSFMPGTNTTLDSFYESTDKSGITALTRWEFENAPFGTAVAGFVVKQGEFPQLGGNIFATGPQNNDMAESQEIHLIAPKAPIVSVEHSFGSGVGGVAETKGADFHTRIALAGIGMTSDYGPSLTTEHYAMQAPDDINRHLDEMQFFNWGYSLRANEANGFTELDSGIPGSPGWVQAGYVLSPPIAAVGDILSGLDHHTQIISGDVEQNRDVLETVQDLLRKAAR